MTLPALSSVKPWGWFIQEFTAMTEKAPPTPEITIGTAAHMWARGESRSQP